MDNKSSYSPSTSSLSVRATPTSIKTMSHTSKYLLPNLPSFATSTSTSKTTAYEVDYPKLSSLTAVQKRPSSSNTSSQVKPVTFHQTAREGPSVSGQSQRHDPPVIQTLKNHIRLTKDVYATKDEYALIMTRLVEAEEAHERRIAEEWIVKKAFLQFTHRKGRSLIGKLHISEEDKKRGNISEETKLRIEYGTWEAEVCIDEILDEEFKITTVTKRDDSEDPPVFNGNFTVTQIFNDVVYARMKEALTRFLTPTAMSNEISSMILGNPSYMHHQTSTIDASRFSKYDLNLSQRKAAQEALGGSPFYLILGPPGTGKTKTSVAIIAELSHYIQTQKTKEKILVCAPSNTAVDDLTLKLHKAGVQGIIRMYSSSKENRGKVDPILEEIILSHKIRKLSPRLVALEAKRKIEPLSKSEFQTYKALKNRLEQTVIEESRIVCCTSSTAGDGRLEEHIFKNVFIDEAAQSIEPDTLIPLTFGAQKVLLAGDHKQLGPVIKNDLVKAAGLERVLFERLMTHRVKYTMLDCQYRMHPLIAEFPSQTFYEGKLKTDDSVMQRHLREAVSSFKSCPVRFFDIKDGVEEKSGTSWMNTKEAFKVERILSDLISLGAKPDDIGIITPYIGQKAILQRKVHTNHALKNVKVASVDEFQGGEKGYIIMSTVRTNNVGFLSDERRLNVAVTRARYGMILVGSAELLRKDKNWKKLIEFYQGNDGFHGASARITDGIQKQEDSQNQHANKRTQQTKANSGVNNQNLKENVQEKYVPQQLWDSDSDPFDSNYDYDYESNSDSDFGFDPRYRYHYDYDYDMDSY